VAVLASFGSFTRSLAYIIFVNPLWLPFAMLTHLVQTSEHTMLLKRSSACEELHGFLTLRSSNLCAIPVLEAVSVDCARVD